MTRKPRGNEKIPQAQITPALREPSSLEVYRPVTPTERTITIFGALQEYIGIFLTEREIEGGERVALDGLRMVLYPPNSLAQIREINPNINNTNHARARTISKLRTYQPAALMPISDVGHPTCPIARINKRGYTVLAFHDRRLIDEQRCIYNAIEGNLDLAGKKHAMIPLYSLPDLDRPVARELSRSLDTVVGAIEVALGPVQFELLGPTE